MPSERCSCLLVERLVASFRGEVGGDSTAQVTLSKSLGS